MREDGAARVGRLLAWLVAASFVAATVLFILVEFDVTIGDPPGRAGNFVDAVRFDFLVEQDRWVLQLPALLLFAVGFMALAGLGVLLGRILGGGTDPRGSLLSLSFAAAGTLGAASQLFFVGVKQVAIDTTVCRCRFAPEQFVSQQRDLVLAENVSRWLDVGFLVLVAAALLLTGALALQRGWPTRPWAQFSFALAALSLISVVTLIPDLEMAFDIMVGVNGGLLVPIWAIWLSRQLDSRPAVAVPPPAPQQAERP